MALNGWLSKCPITINSSQVPADTTNIPIVLITSNFPSEILGATGGCQEDGGDIRFSSDSNGDIELARDVITCDKTGGVLSVYVKIPSISSSVDTTIWCHWNNSSAGEPSETSDSGSKTCWSEYYGVYHFSNMQSGWKGITDYAGKWSNLSALGTIATGTGHIDGSTSYELSSTFGISLPEVMNWSGETNETMFWFNGNGSDPTGEFSKGTNGISFGWLSGRLRMDWGGFAMNTTPDNSTWNHIVLRNDNGVCRTYLNGNDVTSGTGTNSATNFTNLGMQDTLSISISEFRRTRDVLHDQSYYQVMYANESNPAAFATAGTPQTVSVSYALTMSGLQPNTEIRIYAVSDGSELTGIENSTDTFIWNFTHSGDFDVNIYIHNVDYEYIAFENFTVTGNDISIPIQQRIARYQL